MDMYEWYKVKNVEVYIQGGGDKRAATTKPEHEPDIHYIEEEKTEGQLQQGGELPGLPLLIWSWP